MFLVRFDLKVDISDVKHLVQKKRDVHKISACNSGSGHGCANFMGAWHVWFFLLENPHAHNIPPFRGGCWGFLEGGDGSANFIFMGVGILPTGEIWGMTFYLPRSTRSSGRI